MAWQRKYSSRMPTTLLASPAICMHLWLNPLYNSLPRIRNYTKSCNQATASPIDHGKEIIWNTISQLRSQIIIFRDHVGSWYGFNVWTSWKQRKAQSALSQQFWYSKRTYKKSTTCWFGQILHYRDTQSVYHKAIFLNLAGPHFSKIPCGSIFCVQYV